MRGLGKKCKMFLHTDVKAFTDVRGLLCQEYSTLNEAKEGVKRFLEQDIGISFRVSR